VDGSLQSGELVGSIHQVARKILDAPVNGWECWLYVDANGHKQPLDHLRNLYRIENRLEAQSADQ
jgi:hypothetical protein